MPLHHLTTCLPFAMLLMAGTGCAYRESINGDTHSNRILVSEITHPQNAVHGRDMAIRRNPIDVNLNPAIPNP